MAGLLLVATSLVGQVPSPTGNLYGTALDEQAKFLPGVTVTLSGPGAPLSTTSDRRGAFHFLNLAPGAYLLTLEHTGFETAHRVVVVALGRNSVLSIEMSVAEAAEAVKVSGEELSADSRQTKTGAIFDRRELDTIPTTRDPWAVLRQVPGVLIATMNVGDVLGGLQPQPIFVGKGSHSGQNAYNLDGVAITDMTSPGSSPIYFDFDSLNSIDIVTGGSDPSLSTPGVTINLVTKRGTNEFLGSARALFTGTGGFWDYGIEAGGPLWKDHLWVWGAGARNSFPGETFLTHGGEPVHGDVTLEHWNAKLDAQLAPSNSLTFSYLNFNKLYDGRLAGPSHSQPSTWNQTTPTSSYRAEDSEVLSSNLFTSIYFAYLSGAVTFTPQGGLAQQADVDADNVWQNSFEYYRDRSSQHQIGATVSWFFDIGDLRHELKFGVGYRHFKDDSLLGWPDDGLIGIVPYPQAQITRPSSTKYEMNYFDSYLGDTIQIGNLTVNAGVRFDYQQGKNLASSVPANPAFPDLLPAVQYGGDSGYPITWRLFQPRVGAAYAMGSDRRTVLRGSYSRFADQLGSEVATINAFPGPAYRYYGWNDVNGNGQVEPSEVNLSDPQSSSNVDPANPGSYAPVNQIASDFKSPTTDEFIVGVERKVFSSVSVSIAYTHRALRGIEFTPLIGTTRASYQYIGNATGAAIASSGFMLNFSEPYYGLTNRPPPVGTVLQNRPDAKETYSGIELQVVKALSHGWSLRASVAYNDWRQQIGPEAIVDPNNQVPSTNVSGPVVESAGDRFGLIFVNSGWQFNVSGLVELPLGIVASASFFGRQGFPLLYYVQVFTHDTKFSIPDIQIAPTASARLPSVFQLDLHVEKTFRIGSRVTLNPMLDCFNAPNVHTILGRDGLVGSYDAERAPAFGPNKNFDEPSGLLGDRVFRGGVRVSF